MSVDPFFAMRNRAYDLADSGRFERWEQIALVLRAEGFVQDVIERLGGDKLAVMMITRCCASARSGA